MQFYGKRGLEILFRFLDIQEKIISNRNNPLTFTNRSLVTSMVENSELTCNGFSNLWTQVKDKLSRRPLISYSKAMLVTAVLNSKTFFPTFLAILHFAVLFCLFFL